MIYFLLFCCSQYFKIKTPIFFLMHHVDHHSVFILYMSILHPF